jgi:hypothetical protein
MSPTLSRETLGYAIQLRSLDFERSNLCSKNVLFALKKGDLAVLGDTSASSAATKKHWRGHE